MEGKEQHQIVRIVSSTSKGMCLIMMEFVVVIALCLLFIVSWINSPFIQTLDGEILGLLVILLFGSLFFLKILRVVIPNSVLQEEHLGFKYFYKHDLEEYKKRKDFE